MARRKSDSPQKEALREMMSSYMKDNDIRVKDGTDVNSIMRDMMSIILEGTLDAEMDEELGYTKYDYRNKETDNSRNGHSKKTLHTSYGDMEIDVPRDRKGEFEPRVIKKYQNTVTQDMEGKIISMYAKGMTTADIDISDSTISRVTDKILPIIKEWQERPLEEVYAVVFMDAIHYHVRSEGRIVKRGYCQDSCHSYRHSDKMPPIWVLLPKNEAPTPQKPARPQTLTASTIATASFVPSAASMKSFCMSMTISSFSFFWHPHCNNSLYYYSAT